MMNLKDLFNTFDPKSTVFSVFSNEKKYTTAVNYVDVSMSDISYRINAEKQLSDYLDTTLYITDIEKFTVKKNAITNEYIIFALLKAKETTTT